MAKKRTTKRKRATPRKGKRAASRKGKRTTRRRSSRGRTMQAGATDLLKGLAGAYVMAQVIDAPFLANAIKDPKIRYLVGAGASVFVAAKFPKLAPFALGAGVGSGYRAAVAFFPKLAQPLIQGPRRIGRMDQAQIDRLRQMVARSRSYAGLNGGSRGTIMGGNRGTIMGPQRAERGQRAGVIMGGGSFN